MRKFYAYAFIVILSIVGVGGVQADPTSPVSVAITDSPDPVASGAQLTYTFTIQNTAGSKITNVVLSDQLNGIGGIGVPPQLQITSSRGSCAQTTTLVTCNGGTIEGGGVWVVTIAGIVTAPSGTSINNTASVSGTHTAQNFNTTTTISTSVLGGTGGGSLPDLTITKNGPASVVVNSPMTYTLVVNNQGTANATGVKVVDTMPAGVSGIVASGTSLFVCGVSGQTVTCTGGQVNAGSNATITINATSPLATGTITNTASVDPDNTIAESNELNNTSALVNTTVTNAAPAPALGVALTDNPDPVTPGSLLTYQILVTNKSALRADDVNIVDGTQGLDASSLSFSNLTVTNGKLGTKGGCTISAPQVKCYVTSLNPGGTIAVTVTGTVIAGAGSTLIDTCNTTWNISNSGASNNTTVKTTVMPAVDLTITNTDTPDPVCAASWPGSTPNPPVCRGGLTYTLVVGNTGIQDASNVLVRDPLPQGVVFDNCVVPAGSTCGVDANNVFTANLSTVAHQSTVTVTIVCAAPATTGTITNTATVDPNNAIFEADETNNTATQTTTVITGIDLTIAKFDSGPNDPAGFNPVATSGTETYVILVNNLGTQDASNIRVRDTLPSGTRFRDVTSDHGFTCGYSGGVVECIGGAIKGTESVFYPNVGGNPAATPDTAKITIRVFAQPFEGTMHNEVRVDPLGEIAEANETNNIAVTDTPVKSLVSGGGGFNQLTITKTQTSPDKTNTARNAKVTWSIVVGNTGTDTAVGVTVRDYLMAGARYIQATGTNKFNCNQIGGSTGYIDCVGGEIASGTTATITLTAFAPDTPGTYVNQAVADPDNTIPEGDELDNQAFETTIVKNGGAGAFYELSISDKQLTPPSPDKTNTARNAVVTYHMVVTNSGTDTVNGVTVQNTLPAGSRFISATGNNQFLCSNVGTLVTCVNGVVAGGGGTATIDVTAFAPDTPGTYTDQAIVDPNNAIPEGDETNNQDQETTTVKNGGDGAFNDLTIDMTAPDSTTPGGSMIYDITVTNKGTDPALNVAVRDVLPAGVIYVGAADNGGSGGAAFTCSASGSTVNCTGATVPGGGGTRLIRIYATAPQQNITITNQAVVDPDNLIPEGDEFNNTVSKPTTVAAALDLTIEADGPTSASQSDTTDYTVTVHNVTKTAPGQNAIGVVMFDTLPPGLIPLGVDTGSGNNWACTFDQNPINFVRCVGDLPAGKDVTITIHVFITAQDGTALDNLACVDPDNTIVEFSELNNCSELGTFVTGNQKQKPDLFVNKNVDKLAPSPGDILTYTINLQNTGDAKAKTPVTLTDTLPTQVTFQDVSSNPSFNCAFAAGTVTCQDSGNGLDVGGSVDVTIHAKLSDTATGTVSNTATVNNAVADCTDPTQCENETNVNNNHSTVTSSIGSSGIDLYVAAIVDQPDPVAPGGTLKYTITAGNAGTAPSPGSHIEVDLPVSGVTVSGKSASNGFTCDGPDGSMHLDCHGDFPAGGTTTIIVDLQVSMSPSTDHFTVVATADPSNAIAESNEGNNTLTQVTSVTGSGCTSCVDLVASLLTINPEPIGSGGSGTADISFVVSNVGDQPTSFILSPAPAQKLLSLEWQSDGFVTNPALVSSNPAVTCQVDTLDPSSGPPYTAVHASCQGNLSANSAVTITVSGVSVSGTSFKVTGVADPNGHQAEANETNNQLIQTAVINP